ncbi:MAG: LCP family protein [Oscillospiraceae bacterium]|nr:LCP family protein [Oscillospiraceae bacterium]
MKLSGNSRNGRHVDTSEYYSHAEEKKGSALKTIIIILLVLAIIAASLFALYEIGVRPPSVGIMKRFAEKKNESGESSSEDDSYGDWRDPDAAREGNKFTFLVLGTDDGNGNTDTIMVATFDTDNYSLNVVNIPRDTLVNVPWYVKKVNSLYSSTGIDGMIEHLADILGYELDHYAIINLDAFVELVDAVGGVYYNVPTDMDYEDPAQDLYIHIKAGEQLLDGKDAIGVVRFRSGYWNADIGRIATQQDFLKSAIAQILEKKSSIKLTSLVKIFLSDVETDLNYGNLIWFAQEFFKVDSENITFTTMPGNYYDEVDGISFVTIKTEEWLELVNSKLNPYEEDIRLDELSILTRNSDGELYSTNGYYAGDESWGSDSIHYPEESTSTDAEIID